MKVWLVIIFFVFSHYLFSQNAGKDSSCCKLIVYSCNNLYNKLSIDAQINVWRKEYNCCKGNLKTTYIKGINLYEEKISAIKDEKIKNLYLDTLMNLFDERIKYFGEKGSVLGRKGVDQYLYLDVYPELSYNTLLLSVNMLSNDSEPLVILYLIKVSCLLFDVNKLSESELSDILDLANNFLVANQKNVEKEYTMCVDKIKSAIDNCAK